MRKFSLFILMVMFFANTVVVSAWAKPCLMNNLTEISHNIDASSMSGDMPSDMPSDMPCHGTQDEQQNTHCGGICLCLHVSVSQTPILDDKALTMPVSSSRSLVIENEVMASRATTPPRRPPKLIS